MWEGQERRVYFPLLLRYETFLNVTIQTDKYFIDIKKSHISNLLAIEMRKMLCKCIYKIVKLLKAYNNIYGMIYTIEIKTL